MLPLSVHSVMSLRCLAGKVEATIRVGGLAQTKTERIKAILAGLLQERGELSLEHLRSLPDDAIKQDLSRWGLLPLAVPLQTAYIV